MCPASFHRVCAVPLLAGQVAGVAEMMCPSCHGERCALGLHNDRVLLSYSAILPRTGSQNDRHLHVKEAEELVRSLCEERLQLLVLRVAVDDRNKVEVVRRRLDFQVRAAVIALRASNISRAKSLREAAMKAAKNKKIESDDIASESGSCICITDASSR